MSDIDLRDLPTVTRADVYKTGKHAGTLERTADGVRFDYLATYLDSGGPPVATTLPLKDEPVSTVAGAVPPFFAGLLPEGRRLNALRRVVKTSPDDELSLLLAIGVDAIGDVSVVPHGEPLQSAPAAIDIDNPRDIVFADDIPPPSTQSPVNR